LKKGVQFQWTSITQTAFDTLKRALVQAPILAVPNFSQQFVLETDAGDLGIGAVLMQNVHPISYLSEALGLRNQALSTYEKECMAILLAIDKWRPYLLAQEFVIKIDHMSLLYLTEQKATTKLQHKAFLKLMDLNFKIQYKKGISNTAADALSRQPHSEVNAISVCQPVWMEKVLQGYYDDEEAKQLLSELNICPANEKGYSLHDGIIKLNNKIWIGNNKLAQNHITQALNSGMQATYMRIKALFFWPRMKQTIADYVQACQVCQQAKVEHVKLPGLLQPLPVPSQAWEVVSMDFVEGLPKSGTFDVILVVIDKFSKYGHFLPLSHPYTALTVAQLYFNNIYKIHGLPQAVISDRDRVFTSNLWRELFKLSDT
jgi:hypothetical protein